MNIARASYKKGDLARAREQLAEVHQTYPQDQEVMLRLANVDLESHMPADAVALLQPLDSANLQNMDFQYLYGSALIVNGRPNEGVPRVELVAGTANRADAYLLAGVTHLQYSQTYEARDGLEAALRLDPHLPNIYNLVGEARDRHGRRSPGRGGFPPGSPHNPEDFQANLRLGTILYRKRTLDEAKTHLEHALQLQPNDLGAKYMVAMLKSVTGQTHAAVHDLEEVAKQFPDWAASHIELAKLYYQLHRPEDGLRERQLANQIAARQEQKP